MDDKKRIKGMNQRWSQWKCIVDEHANLGGHNGGNVSTEKFWKKYADYLHNTPEGKPYSVRNLELAIKRKNSSLVETKCSRR